LLTDQVVPSKKLNPAWSGSLYYLGAFLCHGSYGPFLYVYFSELGLSGQQVGWLAIGSPLMTLLLATPIASLADRKRWRVRIAQIAMFGMGVVLFLLRYPTTFTGILGLGLLMAILSSPVMSITDSLVARMSQRHHLNYGAMRLWGSVGYATSALAFGAVWQRLGFGPMFLVGSLLFLPLIWVTGRLEEGQPKDQQEQGKIVELLSDPGLVLLLLATILAGIANSLSMTFEGIYVRSLGGGNFLIGMMIAFAAYSELPTMFFGDRLAKRLRRPNTVILAYGLAICAYLGYILIPNPAILPLFSILKGLGFGLFFPNTVRIVTERTPEKWASTAQSLMTVGMFGIAPLVAGPLGGFIHDAIGPAAVFGLGTLALGLAAIVLWLATKRGKLN
jgi:MFS transporter, PPP family, 3-phenylpropionic acid transporter